MGKFIEEKALDHKFHHHGHHQPHHRHHQDHHHRQQQAAFYHYCSLEERVSEFFNNDFTESDVNCLNNDINATTADGYGSDGNESNDSIQHTLYWESQEALLQELLERYMLIGSKLRQEINGIIEEARETAFCSCINQSHNQNICINCLRHRVINLLCRRGLNATLCVSKWKHTKNYPAGTHEYIEVMASTQGRKKQIPFVIELEFRDQFEIAKACDDYAKLVDKLPVCYVGKIDYLNPILGVMCDAAKRSMEEKKIHMGPWRKRSFMQMKWSSSSDRRSFIDQPPSPCSKSSKPAAVDGFIPKPKIDTLC